MERQTIVNRLWQKPKTIRSTGETIVLWVVFILLALYAASLLYPFIYLFFGSFKGALEFRKNPLGMPENWNTKNYKLIFDNYNMGEMFFNSITLTFGNTIVSMLLSCMAAYVLSKYRFKGNEFVYTAVIVASMIPTVAALPATYKLMSDTGLMDSYVGMILLQCGAFGGSFMYLHAYFKGIPWSYAESAMLDGASELRVFFTIMIPLARKSILTFSIIRFLGFWNDYWLPSLFYSEHPTVAVGLSQISAKVANRNDPVLFAAMIISVVPVLIFYTAFQKQLMGNTIGGGLKE
ncbi:MAG: carbohydrate ABC transporter permease [Christensenellaceae bacterium]